MIGADQLSLDGLTKAELLQVAADRGVTGVSARNTKAQIIEALEG